MSVVSRESLGPVVAGQLERGWLLFERYLLLHEDWLGPFPIEVRPGVVELRVQASSWKEALLARPSVAPAPQASQQEWLDPAQVAQRLGISTRTLARVRSAVPPGLPGAPVNAGSGTRRARWRWAEDTVDTWWEEAEAWRASTREERATASAGETRTGRRAAGPAPAASRRRGSSGRSKPASPKAGGGRLVTLVRDRLSETS